MNDQNKEDKTTIDILKEYISVLNKDLKLFQDAMQQGVKFKYRNGEEKIIPFFFEIERYMLAKKNENKIIEYPVSFEMTFTPKDLDDWFQRCKDVLDTNSEPDEE